MPTDLLLDKDNNIIIRNGDFVIGESTTQEVAIILGMCQGESKEYPLIGPNLVQLMKGRGNQTRILSRVKLHLAMDGKDYEQIKRMIDVSTSNG